MKKIVTILFALVLILTMSTNAFAATIESNSGSQDIDVNAKYVDGVSVPPTPSAAPRSGTLRPTPTPPAPSLHGRQAATPSP